MTPREGIYGLLAEFTSPAELVRATEEDRLAAVVGRAAARKVKEHYARE